MKNILAGLLAALILSLSACGGGGTEPFTSKGPQASVIPEFLAINADPEITIVWIEAYTEGDFRDFDLVWQPVEVGPNQAVFFDKERTRQMNEGNGLGWTYFSAVATHPDFPGGQISGGIELMWLDDSVAIEFRMVTHSSGAIILEATPIPFDQAVANLGSGPGQNQLVGP